MTGIYRIKLCHSLTLFGYSAKIPPALLQRIFAMVLVVLSVILAGAYFAGEFGVGDPFLKRLAPSMEHSLLCSFGSLAILFAVENIKLKAKK